MKTVLKVLRKDYEVPNNHPYLRSLMELDTRVPEDLDLDLWEINFLWESYSLKFACEFLILTEENIQGFLKWLEDDDE